MTRFVKGQTGASVLLIDGAAGAETLAATIPEAIAPAGLALSADGTSWAGWFVVADLTPNNIERHKLRYRLYAKTPDVAEPKALSEVEAYEGPWKLSVSPDGHRAAFYYMRELYVLSMP
jgi:hypothetical protein